MDGERLTTDSNASELPGTYRPDLYEFDMETGKVSDLSVALTPAEPGDVQGMVLGASEDGSNVYFAANGVLAQGASPGNCESQPAVPNRAIGDDAGIGDQGQASKLLARLHKLGLIENKGGDPTRGEPNAWTLTPTGTQVHDSIARLGG